jgi:hypothetical protein
MTVFDLIARIIAAYPGATAEAMKTFAPVFHARLRQYEGAVLEDAATAVLGAFKPTTRQPFPIPADFEAHLPAGGLKLPAGGPALDVKGHGDRTRRIMAEWRAAQGQRGTNGVREVLRALEFIAEPLASQKAWANDPEPLRLTKAQLKLAQHRAISQQRRIEHGPPGKDPDLWWEQVAGIAARWGIETTRDEWTTDTPARQDMAA